MTASPSPPRLAGRRPVSKFRRLAVTHALMMGGDAAMVIALADSLFFDIDLNAARTRVLLFLALSFAPFLFVAPLIGPMIDRIAGGRRFVVQLVAAVRVVLLVLMARYIDALALFPLVFANLVLQKTYVVSKSALVPSTVRAEVELVEANSKLGLVSGITGAVAAIPAALLLTIIGPTATLVYGAAIFAAALVTATRLPRDVVAAHAADREVSVQLRSGSLQIGALVMVMLRAGVGFTFFHLAFWLRSQEQGTLWFGAVVGASGLVTMAGNATAPRLRDHLSEESMLRVALVGTTVAGLGAAVIGGPAGALLLVSVLNFSAAIGRLSFESIVQRDAPGANRGQAFARFETQFQLSWAVAAFIAVAIQVSGPVGFLVVGVAAGGTLVNLVIETRQRVGGRRRSEPARPRQRRRVGQGPSAVGASPRRRRPAPTRARVPRSRSGSASRRRR